MKEFILSVLGPGDDIIYFRYTKHINKEFGPVLLGIETRSREDSGILMEKMRGGGIVFEQLFNLNEI